MLDKLSISEMSDISIWGYSIPCECLSVAEAIYLRDMPLDLPTVDWVCEELDRIWNEFGLDNRSELQQQSIGAYYGHPVWVMNGIFSVRDPASQSHRTAIARYLQGAGVKLVADYGGGFGELARAVARAIPDGEISLVEPFPSLVGVEGLKSVPQIKLVSSLSTEGYEAIIAQDVLEHVEDPIKLASELAGSVHIGGKIIFANCFYPVIQCHLPATFHLRHTFPIVMKALGLRFVGLVDGAVHAQVFERVGQLSLSNARRADKVSRLIGPVLNHGRLIQTTIKRFFFQ